MFRIDSLARRFERGSDPGERLARKLPGASVMQAESCSMLAHLHELLRRREHVQLRELHSLIGWRQPRALRAIHELQQHGFVILGHEEFDPLAAHVSIPLAIDRRIGKLLRGGRQA